jgi:hypothetical protein
MLPLMLVSEARLDWSGQSARWDWTDWVGSIALLLCALFLIAAALAMIRGNSPMDAFRLRRRKMPP